jgi:hypothetical protein
MGHVAKVGAQQVGSYVKKEAKENITKDNIKKTGGQIKAQVGNVAHEASEVRDRAVGYSERVNANTKKSSLFDMGHERSESILFGGSFEKREHRRGSIFYEPPERHKPKVKSKQAPTIHVHIHEHNGGRRKKKRRTQSNHSILF